MDNQKIENKSKKSITDEVGRIPENVTSLGATLAMGVLIIAPFVMAVMAMFKQSIDFTMYMYLSMIKDLVFPLACSIVFIIYIIVIMRYQSEGIAIRSILIKNPVFVIFFAVTAWILISQFYNGAQYALTGFNATSLGETFGMEICYFIFILFGATQVKSESHKRGLLRTQIIVSCVLVLAAFILWHSQVESSFFSDWTPRFSSIFSNTNYYGYYLTVSVALAGASFVYENGVVWKAVSGTAFILNTIALSLDDTMGAWVGSIFAVIFIVAAHLIIEKKVNWQALVLIPVFALSLYIPGHINGNFESNFSSLTSDVSNIMEGNEKAEHAGSARWKIWKASLEIVNDNKFMGIGFEGVKKKGYVGAPYNIRPHNEFIQLALFHGYPAALFYIIGCLGIFIRALRKRKVMNGATLVSLCAAFGYLVSSFFGLTVFSTGYFLFVFLGMGYVSGDTLDSPKPEQAKKNRNENISVMFLVFAGMAILVAIAGGLGLNQEKAASKENGTTKTEVSNAEEVSDPLPLFTVDGICYYVEEDHAVVSTYESVETDSVNLEIPEKVEIEGTEYPVTVIDDYAFSNFEELESIVIPNSIEVIGDEILGGCINLTEFELPSSVKEIGVDLFYGCDSLQTVKFPEGIKEIPERFFAGCTGIEEITIPETVQVLGPEVFESCENLKKVVLQEGLVTIEDSAFYSCTNLKEITIPSTVISVGDGVFDSCDGLKTVNVPADKKSTYKKQFENEGYEFKVKGY